MSESTAETTRANSEKSQNDVTREWTIIVFFAGESRLADEMVYQLKDLKRLDPDPDRVAVVAEFGSRKVKKRDVTATNLATPRRFHLVTDSEHPPGSVVMNLVEVEKPARTPVTFADDLVDFILWAIFNFRAKKYMVVFGGDGGGVLSDFLPTRGKSPKSIRPRDLSTIFRRVRGAVRKNGGRFDFKIDIIGLDACLMSMAEICYGLREYGNYLISSEGNEDLLGWPYADVFKILKPYPATDAETLASSIVDGYNAYYLDYALIGDASANLSAVRLERMEHLAAAVKKFCTAANRLLSDYENFDQLPLPQQIFVGLLIHAHWVAQSYREDQYTDIGDFFMTLRSETVRVLETQSALSDLHAIVDCCDGVLEALGLTHDSTRSAIVKSCHVGVDYQYSTGLAVYFPWSHVDEDYFVDFEVEPDTEDPETTNRGRIEAFARATGWGNFLSNYVRLTRRPPKSGLPNDSVPERIAFFHRDPPKGRGTLPLEVQRAKNPPDEWNISSCVIKPLLESLAEE
ncbi:MAG TPA: clostripain-related cysteine peptidase [Pyrinomonadaceae bacterium]